MTRPERASVQIWVDEISRLQACLDVWDEHAVDAQLVAEHAARREARDIVNRLLHQARHGKAAA